MIHIFLSANSPPLWGTYWSHTQYTVFTTWELWSYRKVCTQEREGKEQKKEKQQKTHISQIIKGDKKGENFHLSLDTKSCFCFSVTKILILQWVFCILDLTRRAALQPATFDTIK